MNDYTLTQIIQGANETLENNQFPTDASHSKFLGGPIFTAEGNDAANLRLITTTV